jgi:hypothetical protein
MGCVTGRVRITAVSKLRLFAQAAGFCENPTCLRDLFLDLGGGPIHVGEMAHIVAATRGGPRGEWDLDLDDRAGFENVILLCPTCHTAVDKAPADFPVDELRRWRATHVQRVRDAVGAQRYASRADARRVIAPLFAQNQQIHADYGPESPGADLPESESPRAWHRKITDSILPNSRTILAVLDANRDLLEDEEIILVERLRQHIDDLTARHVLGQREPSRRRFPEGADRLLI